MAGPETGRVRPHVPRLNLDDDNAKPAAGTAVATPPAASSTGAVPTSSGRKRFESPTIQGFSDADHENLDRLFSDFCDRLEISDQTEQKALLRRLERLLELDNEERQQAEDEEQEETAAEGDQRHPVSAWFVRTIPASIPTKPARELQSHDAISTTQGTIRFGPWVLLMTPMYIAESFNWSRKAPLHRGFRMKPSTVTPRPPQKGDGIYELAVGTERDASTSPPVCFYIGETGDLYKRLLNQYAFDGSHIFQFIDEALRCELYIFARWIECKDIAERPSGLKARRELQNVIINRYDYAMNIKKSVTPARPVYVPDY